MKIDIENQMVEINDELINKINQCMRRCPESKSKIILVSTPYGKSKFYDMFKKYLKDKNES